MTERIGGSMYARELREIGKYYGRDDVEVHIWTEDTRASAPSLVIPNLLEVKNLRDYLDGIIKSHPKYFEPRE